MTEKKPAVSVLLTSYNHEAFLPQAVESVLAQEFSDFELIAVDDGSSDGSLEKLRAYRDPRIKVFSQPNLGQAAALNAAYARSCGGIIALMDCDDWWDPRKLQRVVEKHLETGGSYGVLQHNMIVVCGARRFLYRNETLVSGDCLAITENTDRINFFVTTSGLVFTRAVLDQIFPIPEVFRISPDAFLTRAAMALGPVCSIQEPLGFLRMHADNAGMGKPKAFHKAIRKKILYPELNRFYRSRDFRYVFGGHNEKSFPEPAFSEKLKTLLKKILRRFAGKNGSVSVR